MRGVTCQILQLLACSNNHADVYFYQYLLVFAWSLI